MKRLLIVAFCLLLSIFTGCSANGGSSQVQQSLSSSDAPITSESSEPPKEEASSEASKEETIAQVGDTIEVENGLFMTVNGVRLSFDGFMAPEGAYLVFDCTFENKSSDEYNLSTLANLYIKDNDGTKYTPALGAETNGSLDGTLPPDEKQKGEVAFDVPIESEITNFYYEPFLNMDGFKTSKWSIMLRVKDD